MRLIAFTQPDPRRSGAPRDPGADVGRVFLLSFFFWAFLVKRNQGRKRRINELFAQPAHAERHTKEKAEARKGRKGRREEREPPTEREEP